MTQHRLRGIVAYVRLGAILAWQERADLLARTLLFPLFLGIFAALWRAIAETRVALGVPVNQVIWYLAVTEWILCSVPHPEFEIEQQVRRGDIGYQLARPVSLLTATVAQGMGSLGLRAPVFALAAWGTALLFAGALPAHPGGLVWALAFGLFAIVVLFMFQVALGICAFWFQNIAPLGWIWNKSAFLFGGLMLPLPLYPELIQRMAEKTPFPALLYGPARFVLDGNPDFAGSLLISQLGWFVVAGAIALGLYRTAVDAVTINGG
jgi:ABC-2 type transport system permease protein